MFLMEGEEKRAVVVHGVGTSRAGRRAQSAGRRAKDGREEAQEEVVAVETCEQNSENTMQR